MATRFPSIPDPAPELTSVHQTVSALKEGYEVLTNQRANLNQRRDIGLNSRDKTQQVLSSIVTWQDLLNLGLIQENQVPK